jgi:hypothetical protein
VPHTQSPVDVNSTPAIIESKQDYDALPQDAKTSSLPNKGAIPNIDLGQRNASSE